MRNNNSEIGVKRLNLAFKSHSRAGKDCEFFDGFYERKRGIKI
jgi:hypothetical protein